LILSRSQGKSINRKGFEKMPNAMGWDSGEDKNRFRALSLLHELATPRSIKTNNQNEVVEFEQI